MKPMAKFKVAFLFAATVVAVVSGTTLIFPDGKLLAHDAGSSVVCQELAIGEDEGCP